MSIHPKAFTSIFDYLYLSSAISKAVYHYMSNIKRHRIKEFKEEIGLSGQKDTYFLKEFTNDIQHPEQPYRTQTFGVGYLKKGQLFLTTGVTDHEINAPALIAMGPNVIRKWIKTYKAIEEDTIFFSKDFLVSAFANSTLLSNIPYFEQADLHVFALNKTDNNCIKTIFATLKSFLSSDYINKDHFVRQQITILHYMLDEFYKRNVRERGPNPEASLLEKFKELAVHSIKKHRDVKFYAESLFITSKHLSETIKKATGKTAGQFLHGMLVLEAKIMLQDPGLTITQVAYELNFPDPSTFGKYFKKYTGQTPSGYQSEILTS